MTPNIPPRIQIEMARREVAMLTKQRDVARDSIAQLSEAAAQLGYVDHANCFKEQSVILTALSALVGVRLLELQMSFTNLETRILELEGAIAQVDSGIVIPGARLA